MHQKLTNSSSDNRPELIHKGVEDGITRRLNAVSHDDFTVLQ